MIIEIESGVIDECPKCGCKKLLEIAVTANDEMGRRKHKSGVKCFDCGIIFITK